MRKLETQKGSNMDPGKKQGGYRRQESWKRVWMRFKCKSFTSSNNNHNTREVYEGCNQHLKEIFEL
jgi:hypothetical protein